MLINDASVQKALGSQTKEGDEEQELAEGKEEVQEALPDFERAAERIYELHTDEIIKTFTQYQEAINEKAQAIQRELEEAMRAVDRQ